MELDLLLVFVATGAFAGTLAGMMGVGGGVIYVPLLIFLFERWLFDQEQIPLLAVSTSLAIILFSISSSAVSHYREGNLHLGSLKHLVIGGVFGALLASLLLRFVSADPFKMILGAFQLYLGQKLFFGQQKEARDLGKEGVALTRIGALAGGISGFFGVGGGMIVVPLLHLGMGVSLAQSVGTATGFMLFTVSISLVSYLVQGVQSSLEVPGVWANLYLPAVLAIIPSAMVFSWIGAIMAAKVDGKKLKRWFGLLVMALGGYGLVRGGIGLL